VLAKMLSGDAELAEKLRALSRLTLTNWNGIEVGGLRVTAALG